MRKTAMELCPDLDRIKEEDQEFRVDAVHPLPTHILVYVWNGAKGTHEPREYQRNQMLEVA
jgi:hypothetical protein